MMIVNEKYKFTIDKLVSIKEIIKNIEETNYIDGYLGYEDDFYIDSILYYLKENTRLKDKVEKAFKIVDDKLTNLILQYGVNNEFREEYDELWEILKED